MKVRIIGIILLLVGFIMISFIDHDMIDIFSGIVTGVGLGFTITGRFKKCKSLS
ncbi:hypothetical protein SAMN05444483_11025 [Salegentibacter echinorum]|uniref:Uncharacterized protein n=1 Tax=Salegentibacter echinorum TaxID=1073325 RepID=A0A1M5J8L5_SALEC|nr:hypothetical protein SAMN05444483_11025 [Salegentibacter echinorum]